MRNFCQHACRVSVLFMFLVAMVGCGGNSAPACKVTAIKVFPATATISHTAPPPGNTQHFDAFESAATPGCLFAQSNLTSATWSVSDTTNVSISNVQGATFGTATCNGATSGAATVTATVPAGDGTSVTNTASLTCN